MGCCCSSSSSDVIPYEDSRANGSKYNKANKNASGVGGGTGTGGLGAQSSVSGGGTTGSQGRGAPSRAAVGYNTLLQRAVTVSETCEMGGVVFSLLYIGGALWCLMKDHVEVRDRLGRLISRRVALIHNARGMTRAVNGHVVIATENDGLVALDPASHFLQCVAGGKYKDVAKLGNSIWGISDTGKDYELEEYLYTDKAWHKGRTMELAGVPWSGYRITCEGQGEHLYVSCYASPEILQVDEKNGTTLRTFAPPSQLKGHPHPFLCASDSDSLVIGGLEDHTLWLLDPNKERWVRIPGTGLIKSPHAAVMDHDGKLYVSGSSIEGGVFLYTCTPL